MSHMDRIQASKIWNQLVMSHTFSGIDSNGSLLLLSLLSSLHIVQDPFTREWSHWKEDWLFIINKHKQDKYLRTIFQVILIYVKLTNAEYHWKIPSHISDIVYFSHFNNSIYENPLIIVTLNSSVLNELLAVSQLLKNSSQKMIKGGRTYFASIFRHFHLTWWKGTPK